MEEAMDVTQAKLMHYILMLIWLVIILIIIFKTTKPLFETGVDKSEVQLSEKLSEYK